MSISNPSHLLISRNPPRSPAHPQLAPALTSRHGPLSPPSSSSPPRPTVLGRWHHSADELEGPGIRAGHRRGVSGGSIVDDVREGEDVQEEEEDEEIQVHKTFWKDASLPGRAKVIVGKNEFWCHKEVLWFASPFFQGLLEGNWAENYPETEMAPSPADVPFREARRQPPSPPTDTDPPSPIPRGPSESIGSSITPSRLLPSDEVAISVATVASNESPVPPDDGAQGEASDEETKTASVYLDAAEDGGDVAVILKELREIPEGSVTGDAEGRRGSGATIGASPALGEVAEGEAEPSRPNTAPPQAMAPPPVNTFHLAPASALTLASSEAEIEAESEDEPVHALTHPPNRRTNPMRASFSSSIASRKSKTLRVSTGKEKAVVNERARADVVVELHEESAAAFQDFLFWAYPHLECKVTWTNVEDLLSLSSKLIVPALQRMCHHFLMTHASGRPVMALSLAEQHENAELFREASRFVLDQPTWDQDEMETLSEMTQLKLSKRRNWFLERLLKLGSIDVKKDYTCRPDCPDPTRCQTQLDEKWRQAHTAVCRYGPPQPSVAFRCLRQLETFPTNPSLVMQHPLCQSTAKSWVMSLFDRMFQPKIVFSNPGTEKYWLWITMN
ncbi:hypothetical protein IAT38_006566 [Cryptococcus sp. DSM 104549]